MYILCYDKDGVPIYFMKLESDFYEDLAADVCKEDLGDKFSSYRVVDRETILKSWDLDDDE